MLVTQGMDHHELIMRTGQSIELEETYPQPDGKVEYFQVVKSPVFGPDKQVIGSQGIQFEITEQRRAQAALLASEQEFRTLAESVPQIVWITRTDGWNVYFNRRWVDYTGLTLEESYGHNWITPFHPDDQKRAWDAWQRATKNVDTYSIECRLRRADGAYRRWLIRGVPMRNASGEILKWFGTCTDIEDIKQAQDEVQKLNAHLEQRVRDRTAELEAVNNELEAFSYSVSHDLRAPVRAIDGFARILADEHAGALTAEGHRVLNVVMKEGERMGRLIDDLLAFSRIGRQSPQTEEIDVAALVDEVYRELAALAPGRRIELRVAALPRAQADLALLRQVLVNLIGNAIKYTRPRELARIEVGGSVRGSENVYQVKDNGAGFDPRFADKLFGVFQRLHSEAEFEGTGVGLALVQRIINRHGGRVWAESQVDQGATFYFTLPARPN
jgi:PAS domain S-box-containing protein